MASCSVTLLYFYSIFIYFIEYTRNSSSSLMFSDSDSGSDAFSWLDSRLLIYFYSSFILLTSFLRSANLFSSSYFLVLTFAYRPFFNSWFLSLTFLSSFSSTLMMVSLFLMDSVRTFSRFEWDYWVGYRFIVFLWCSSYLSSLASIILRVWIIFLF